MMRSTPCLLLIVALLVAGLPMKTGANRPPDQVPALEQAAPTGPGVADAAMLAVTRAGPRLVAVGERGIIRYSDDHGQSWQQASVPVSATLTEVQFVDERTGWAVGHLGVVLRSVDGGKSWAKQLDGRQASQLAVEDARRRAQEAGDDPVAARALEQAEWLVEDGPDKPFLDLHFHDAQEGFVVGAFGLILRTEDGGKNWQPWMHRIDNPDGWHLYGIAATRNGLIVVGERGLLLRQDMETGHLAVETDRPYEGSYFGIASRPQDDAVVIYGLRGHAYLSEDGGRSWRNLPTRVESTISDALFLADGRLLLFAQGGEVLLSAEDATRFERIESGARMPVAGAAPANTSMVLVGLHGIRDVDPLPALARSRHDEPRQP